MWPGRQSNSIFYVSNDVIVNSRYSITESSELGEASASKAGTEWDRMAQTWYSAAHWEGAFRGLKSSHRPVQNIAKIRFCCKRPWFVFQDKSSISVCRAFAGHHRLISGLGGTSESIGGLFRTKHSLSAAGHSSHIRTTWPHCSTHLGKADRLAIKDSCIYGRTLSTSSCMSLNPLPNREQCLSLFCGSGELICYGPFLTGPTQDSGVCLRISAVTDSQKSTPPCGNLLRASPFV